MGPQTGGLLGADIVQQVDKRASVDDQIRAVAAVEEIGIIFASDHQTQLLIQVAGEKLELELDAELFFDLLVDLVVLRRLITGIATENSQRDGLLALFRKHGNGEDEGQQHDHHHQGRHKSFHFDSSLLF